MSRNLLYCLSLCRFGGSSPARMTAAQESVEQDQTFLVLPLRMAASLSTGFVNSASRRRGRVEESFPPEGGNRVGETEAFGTMSGHSLVG
jgi:hypothetical protein